MKLRQAAAFAAIAALASTAWADGEAPPPPPSSQTIQQAARTARVKALVAKAEREKRAGRLAEAAEAYAEAIELERDPLVSGRLGVLLVELGSPAEAADLLLDAIELATGADPSERHAFLTAYDKARAEVCRIDVSISEAHTTVMLDGALNQSDAVTGYTLFLPPGEHELRASLPHFEDGVAHFTAWKGGKLRVTLTLLPEHEWKPLDPPVRLLRKPKLERQEERALTKNAELPPDDEPAKREPVQGGVEGAPRGDKPRVVVGAGPVVVFGVASWQPAVGPMAGVAWRPQEYFSLGIEGRAAWLTSGVEGMQISAMTAGGIASACGHWRWLFGCALGHLGIISIRGDEGSYRPKTDTFVKPGAGGRVGAALSISRGFALRASLDALVLDGPTKIVAGQTVLVDQPPVMLGAQLAGGWEF